MVIEKSTKKELLEHISVLEEKLFHLQNSPNGHDNRPGNGLVAYDETLKGFIEGCPDGVGLVVDGRVAHANATLREMSGRSDDEMFGMLVSDLLAPADRGRAEERIQSLMKGEEAFTSEYTLLRKDGQKLPIEVSSHQIKFCGKPAIMSLVRDVTLSHEIRTALFDAEERYRTIVESAVFGIYETTLDGRFISANQALADMLLYESNEKLVDSIDDIGRQIYVNSSRRDEFVRLINENGSVTRFESEVYRNDGSRIWISLTARAIRDAGCEVVSYEGMVEDVTERKRVELALQESEEQYRRMVEDVAHGVFTTDSAGVFTYVNPQAARLTGFAANEILGRHFTFLIQPDWKGHVIRFYREQLESGERSTTLQFPIITKRGDMRWVEQLVTRIDGKAEPAGVQAIVYDITERKEAEEALLRARDELEDRVRERTREIREANHKLKHELEDRKKAEEALQDSEVRNRAILDALPDCLFLIGTDGTLKDFVASVEELAFPPDQWLGKRLQDVMPEHISNLVMDAVQNAVKEGQTQAIEYEMPLSSSGEEPRSWEGRIVVSGKNEVLAIVRDVSESKKAQLALERVTKERSIIAEIARVMTSSFDLDEIYNRVTEELAALINFDRLSINIVDEQSVGVTVTYSTGKEMEGRNTGDVYVLKGTTIEHVIRTRRPVLIHMADEDPYDISERFPALLKYPAFKSFLSVPMISEDRVIGAIIVRALTASAFSTRDLEFLERVGSRLAAATVNAQLDAERRQAEEILKITQYSVDHAADAVFWLGKDSRFQFVNEAACKTLGYTKDEFLNMRLSDINPNHIESDWPEQWERVKDLGSNRIETTHLSKDGRTIPIELTVDYLEFNGQEFHFAYARDITNRKRLESQLVESQKMEAVGRLAGGVAHDFNNFLTPMMSYAYLATQMPNLDDKLREYLGEIQKAAEHAANVTNQLLAFSRRQLVVPKVVDLNDVMFNMDRMLRRLLGKDLEMVAIPDIDPMLVKVDPGQIEQVLVNLVVNARDALPDGGKIILRTYNAEESELQLGNLDNGEDVEYIVLSVEDNGIGMDDEVKSHMFEPFFTTKDADKGTGLGLSTCYGIVKQAGGDIKVDSSPGEGTNFKVFLPRIEPAAIPLENALASASLPRGAETILVVEDEPMVRNVAAHSLRDLGYKVFEASNGDEALRLLESPDATHVDLLLSDIIMPLMGGVGLMEKLGHILPNVPVILTSGYADNGSLPHGILQPTTAFLRKPFTPADLAKKVRGVLDKRR